MIVSMTTNIPLQSGVNGSMDVHIRILELLSATAKLYPGIYFTTQNNYLVIMIDDDNVERDLGRIKATLLACYAEINQFDVEITQIKMASLLPVGPVQLSGLLLRHYLQLTRIGVPADLQSANDAYAIRIQSIQARFRLYREGSNNNPLDRDNFSPRGTFMGNRINFMNNRHSPSDAFGDNPFQSFDTQENLRKFKQQENIEIEKTLIDVIGLIQAYNAQAITGEQARHWMNVYSPNFSNEINTNVNQEGEETFLEISIVSKNPTSTFDSAAHAKRVDEINIFTNLCKIITDFNGYELNMPVGHPIWTLKVKNYVVPSTHLESFKRDMRSLLYRAGLDKCYSIGGINFTLGVNHFIRAIPIVPVVPAPVSLATSSRPATTHTDAPHTAAGKAHDKLLKHLAKSIPADKLNDNKPFLDAINERQYTKALRRACTSTDEQTALKLIKVLMSYKGRLSFNVNEQAGPEQLTALHYAAKSANSEIFDFLIRQDADQTIVDKAGMKARDYMQNVNLQRKVQA